MATLWETITENSSLPVQAGNTFWDHLNNQEGGGPITLTIYEDLAVELADCNYDVEMNEDAYEVELEESGFVIELDEPQLEIELDEDELTVEIC